ncbi:RNA polymerase factor sigma-54 [Bacillus sp. V3B]|uniref:RNA polymerase factor sigma-54 n=1 Tax=Bacillus sp. V3B TaxID=2804915 RepID=UPI00210EA73B|nr:RNA polymerase factor sigma-54 [Bacillus sp. V3B]MCQ6275684.1 RNA polymerase factor sigma-54 [Bacillus sp. V3B]
MDMKVGLGQQQTVKLAMTQELTQAIALLQYSTQELVEFLENKAIENPLLQIESRNIQTMDPQYDRVKKVKKATQVDKQSWLEQIAQKETSLVDYLFSQIDFRSYDDSLKKVLTFLINSLDENGYLHISSDEVATILSISCQEVEEAVRIIQGLEPAGVGARNLQECLLFQINREEDKNKLAATIISDYFLLFAEKKWKLIAKNLGVEMKQIQQVFDYVQSLNPRPAAAFYYEQASYIVPDIIIKCDSTTFSVSVFDEVLPKIQFNKRYFRKFHAIGDEKVKRFLQEKQQDYQWIMRSIEQRKETLIKVALKIIEKQPDFFIHGPNHVKPITMKEVSEELGIHESTVSRAVREKYAQTPFGTIELKSFFSSTIKTISNEDTSAIQVKKEISLLIEKEDKLKPLSDQELVALLKANNGIVVSRRTIAKYRDQLGILASSKRKRFR